MKRLRILGLAGLLAAPGVGAEQFQKVELTAEDILSVYDIRPEQRPAFKFEWNFDQPTATRVIVESKTKNAKEWTVVSKINEASASKASLVIFIDLRPEARLTGDGLLLRMRWGFEETTANGRNRGWGSRDVILPGPFGTLVQQSWSQENPAEMVVLKTTTSDYRVRFEKDTK